jgi:hypothetical protein
LALAILYEAYARARRQRGGEPVMVVACADSAVGRTLITRRRGFDVLDELVGPMVWAWTEAEAADALTPMGWKGLSQVFDAIGHVDGGMRILLAVNTADVEPRVFRMAPVPAPKAKAEMPKAEELNAAAAQPAEPVPAAAAKPVC